jgi:hypothetical protein
MSVCQVLMRAGFLGSPTKTGACRVGVCCSAAVGVELGPCRAAVDFDGSDGDFREFSTGEIASLPGRPVKSHVDELRRLDVAASYIGGPGSDDIPVQLLPRLVREASHSGLIGVARHRSQPVEGGFPSAPRSGAELFERSTSGPLSALHGGVALGRDFGLGYFLDCLCSGLPEACLANHSAPGSVSRGIRGGIKVVRPACPQHGDGEATSEDLPVNALVFRPMGGLLLVWLNLNEGSGIVGLLFIFGVVAGLVAVLAGALSGSDQD